MNERMNEFHRNRMRKTRRELHMLSWQLVTRRTRPILNRLRLIEKLHRHKRRIRIQARRQLKNTVMDLLKFY